MPKYNYNDWFNDRKNESIKILKPVINREPRDRSIRALFIGSNPITDNK